MEIDGFLRYAIESIASGEGANDLADEGERAPDELRAAKMRAVDL